MTKVTIKYMDNSISVIDFGSKENEDLKINTEDDDGNFIIENSDGYIVGWVVRENVRYITIGELIDQIKDIPPNTSYSNNSRDTSKLDRHGQSGY